MAFPKNPAFPTPVVRFLGQRYDGGYFLGFPHRCRVTELSIHRPKSAYVAARLAPFLQAWLFFGLLHLVFNDSGEKFIRLQHEECGSVEELITTSKLLEIQSERVDDALRLKKERPSTYRAYIDYCQKCFREVEYILTAAHPSIIQELGAEIWTSIHMLLQYAVNTLSLVNNFRFITESRSCRVEPEYDLLTPRMRTRGWCPVLIQMLKTVGDIDSLYYVSNMDLNVAEDHSCCTKVRCIGNQINNNDYTPQHAKSCSDPSTCIFKEVKQTELVSILETGSIPLIRCEKLSKRRLCIQLVSSAKETRYVALSHVWSQGKGNPTSNSLPQCQLSYIADKVDALYPGEDAVAFWIDTVCCPIKPARAQALALEKMAVTYENADKVLVIDSALETALLPGEAVSDMEECLLHILASSWMRRMWTLQEGLLAKRLYIQFLDGALDIWDAKRHVMVSELLPFFKKHIAQGQLKKGEASFAIWKTTGIYRLLLFFEQSLLTVQIRKRPVLESITWPLSFRSASVAEDEALCIGTLLRLDMRRILSVSPEERMAKVWTLLDEQGDLRQSLLFHGGPKLDIDRYKWAPKTLLGINEGVVPGYGPSAKISESGLLFDCPGFVLYYRGSRLVKRVRFRTSTNRRYWCNFWRPISNDSDGNGGRPNADAEKYKSSLLAEEFYAILIRTDNFDVPDSGLENSTYPKMDVCNTRFDESFYDDISGIHGVSVMIERVEGNVWYVRHDCNVFITREKELPPVNTHESYATLFDEQLHSWLAEDRTAAQDAHMPHRPWRSQVYLPNLYGRCFENKTWCCG